MTLLASFNQLKLWLQVWGPMKFQPDETPAEGVGSDESFNRMKLWPEVGRWVKVSTS